MRTLFENCLPRVKESLSRIEERAIARDTMTYAQKITLLF